MPKPRTTLIYQFDELNEEAKERAREWYRQEDCDDIYWSECVIDDAATIAGFLGLDINQTAYKTMGGETKYKPTVYFSGFWSQGGGAWDTMSIQDVPTVEGTWRASDVKADKLKEYAPQDQELHRIVDGLADLAKEYPDGSFTVKHSFNIELPCEAFDEAEYGYPEHKRLDEKISNDEETLKELARDFMGWIHGQLKKEWEYQNSDEQVEESIRANEYEFLENGTRA